MKFVRLIALCCAFGMGQAGLVSVSAQSPSSSQAEPRQDWLQATNLTSEWVDLALDDRQNVWTVSTEYPAPIVLHSFTTSGGEKKRFPLDGKYKGTIEAVKILYGKDGNLLIAGHFSGKVTIGDFKMETAFAGSDLFILSYHIATQKVNYLQKIDLGGDEKARALIQDGAGNLYLGGYSEVENVNLACIIRLNAEGKIAWQQIAEKDSDGITGTGTSAVFALTLNPKGGIYATGWFDKKFGWGNEKASAETGSDIFMTAVSETGHVTRLQTFGGTDWEAGRAISTDPEGNVYVGGWFWGALRIDTHRLVSRGASDIFIAKFSPEGDLLSVQSHGSTEGDALFDLRWEQNKLWGCGWFSQNLSLGATTLQATGDRDAFAFQADGDGNVLKATTWGGHEEDKAHALLIDAQSMAYIIGYHDRPNAEKSTESAFSFVAKWGEIPLPTPVMPAVASSNKTLPALQPKVEIYPNPAKEYLNVRLGDVTAGNYQLTLTDMTGKKVLTVEPYFDGVQDRFTWMLPALTSGYYVLSIQQGEQTLSAQKIMIP